MTAIQDRMRDAMIQRQRDIQDRNRDAIDATGLHHPQRAGDVTHLDDDTSIVEVYGLLPSDRDQVHYTVVRAGKSGTYVTSLPLALLYAAQVMTGGRAHDDDYVYAARVLGIKD